ncbi:3-deoxy-D-manno-octulosonic acid transferase [Geothrix sp. PMB-07]|uniref:3-deoxy-D-manno-octulosonic acid transferase n=1 Tax=Geothrix sp. PMB-07 TaxID=3068640 RepID=UPI00274299B7|nr:glycosyltransferase N-terminal domain-containing protein [Geothrix sp. PMB-07]WLT30354.1 glycosyltransferase N-terminal domain-containing protein [Geothrix sp. PMB-07]
MDALDLSYRLAVSLAGAVARACVRGLPPGWRVRLEAQCPDLSAGRWVWLHAVSVGELLLADGLLLRLREAGHRVHLSTGTPAGLELLARRLPRWNADTGLITGGAFPLDDAAGLEPFLLRPPGVFIALETELWPGLLQALETQGVPRLVVNGRLTDKSMDRGGAWLRRAASRLTQVAARDEASAEAFRRLGAPQVALGGNLKADLPPPNPLHPGWNALRAAWAEHPILVAGNTVEGEEAILLKAWEAARAQVPGLRLILAPRQPRRFEGVAQAFAARGLAFRRASDPWPDAAAFAATDVLLLDTLGELSAVYAEGTVALVAGGWTTAGGHNPLEPVRAGVPTLLGPGFTNFEDLVPPLLAAGRLEVVESGAIEERVLAALQRAPLRPGPAPSLPEGLVGALDRTWALIEPHLPRLG